MKRKHVFVNNPDGEGPFHVGLLDDPKTLDGVICHLRGEYELLADDGCLTLELTVREMTDEEVAALPEM